MVREIVIADTSVSVVLGQATTDEEGRYAIQDLPAGPVRVFAAREGYRSASRVVEVIAADQVRVGFALQPIPMPLKGHLIGTVRDGRSEEPIAGALVILIPDNPVAFDLSRPLDFLPFTVTGEEGRYAFRDVPAGLYGVLAAKAGYLPQLHRAVIEPNGVTEVHFLLAPISRPQFGQLAGRITDSESGEPLPGAWIRLQTNDQEMLSDVDAVVTRSDERGFYLFEHVRAGTYRVFAGSRGYETARKEVTVVAGEIARADFALNRFAAFGIVEGDVLDALTNEPIAGALVFVPLLDLPHASGPVNSVFTRTDELGHYLLEEVPAGLRTVVAFRRDYFADVQVVQVAADETSTLDFALLARTGTPELWRIICVNALTGEAIPGARIHLPITRWLEPGSQWDPWFARSDAFGLALLPFVPQGDWSLAAGVEGFVPVFTPLAEDGSGGELGLLTIGAEERTLTLEFMPAGSVNSASDWQLYR
ncbi:carboxypeptidase regulatory-like domain-containing protein [Candidatus Sumerlaeota bacterium]|nr:carboxypeptidase regulatory-like domain-containing protein [Candidatus Sumerlaeota bacterium]